MFQFDDSVKVKQYHPYHKWNRIIISMRTREVMLSKGGIITNEKTFYQPTHGYCTIS
jgi:hypothetical protein